MRFQSWIGSIPVLWNDLREPPLSSEPVPTPPPEKARAVVVSFYMPNMPRRVVAAQRRMVKRYLPPDVAFRQVRTIRSHENALDHFVSTNRYRVVQVLDIDCVPVSATAIEDTLSKAEAGMLAGVIQRSGHIENNNHLYVSPVCMAFSMDTFERLGRPSFRRTARGDVGEELTYVAESRGVQTDMLWPSHSEDMVWELVPGTRYGHGTTYADAYWHAFEIRKPEHHARFVARCDSFLRS